VGWGEPLLLKQRCAVVQQSAFVREVRRGQDGRGGIRTMSQSMTADSPAAATAAGVQVTWADYGRVSALLGVFTLLLVYLSGLAAEPAPRPEQLLGPVLAQVALIASVWLLMAVVRNVATMRGLASPEYYLRYASNAPADWIERPARTFNNLMQMPSLFYAVCAFMLITHRLDRAQLAYAWLFVALRLLHAVIYIGWNPLPYRFATWIMGCITLFVLWTRFALQIWPVL
jgi:hypothetical protein